MAETGPFARGHSRTVRIQRGPTRPFVEIVNIRVAARNSKISARKKDKVFERAVRYQRRYRAVYCRACYRRPVGPVPPGDMSNPVSIRLSEITGGVNTDVRIVHRHQSRHPGIQSHRTYSRPIIRPIGREYIPLGDIIGSLAAGG